MFQVRPVAPDIGPDSDLVLGVLADEAGQGQELERMIQRDVFQGEAFFWPVFRHGLALRLLILFRHIAALDVRSKPAFVDPDFVVAIHSEHLALGRDAGVFVAAGWAEGPGVAAVRVVGAADKGTTRARGTHAETPRAAIGAEARVGAVLVGREDMGGQCLVDLFQHLGDGQVHRLRDGHGEVAPEPVEHAFIIALPGGDIVKLFLEIGGELIAHIFAKEIGQKDRDQPAFILGEKAVLLFAHIAAVLDGRDDGRIGGRAADAQLFHALDQRGLGEARGRLGEMLLGRDGLLARGVAFADLGKGLVVIIKDRIIAAFLVDFQETVKKHHLTRGAQLHLFIGGADNGRGAFQPRGSHLAGDGALVDQVVKLALIGIEDFQAFRIGHHIGGADALMRFLRVFGLVFIHASVGRHVITAEFRLDGVARGVHRLGGHVDAVGPHIGDMARLIEPLRR